MQNVKTGDRVQLSAQSVNDWNHVANAYRAGRFKNLDVSSAGQYNSVIISVQNKTGKPLNVFSVLKLDKSVNLTGNIEYAVLDAINKDVIFEGIAPSADGTEDICITLADIEADCCGQAVLIGAVGCVVDVKNQSHRYAVSISGDTEKLESSESGTIKILNPLTETGEQFCYVLLGSGGSAPASDAITVPVFYPARQWSIEKTLNENVRIWRNNDTIGSRYMESCGLTKEGTTPIPVMTIIDGKLSPKTDDEDNPLYYKNIKLKLAPQVFELDENNQPIDLMKEKFTQPNESRTQWQAVFVKDDPNDINEEDIDVPMLESGGLVTSGVTAAYLWLCHLSNKEGQASPYNTVDFSGQWETTADPDLALKKGHQVIAPHNAVGFSISEKVKYKPSENITLNFTETSTDLLIEPEEEEESPAPKVSYSFPAITGILDKISGVPIVAQVENVLQIIEIGERETVEGTDNVYDTEFTATDVTFESDMLDLNENQFIYGLIPEYVNEKPKDTGTGISIENTCNGEPLLGLFTEGGGKCPSLLFCYNIPYGYCIPLKTIQTLCRINCTDCSPVFNNNKYSVETERFAYGEGYVPLNADYKPSMQ